MKKLLPIIFCFAGFITRAQLNISILNPGNNTVITCATPGIFLQGSSNSTITPITYGWNTPTGAVTGATVNGTTPGIYTLAALAGTATATQTIAIGINTIVPVSSVAPLTQTITCNFNTITNVTCTASSPTTNFSHSIIAPSNGIYVANTLTTSYLPQSVGVFTYVLTNNSNGCQAVKYFTVTSGASYPTYSLTSTPAGYSVGCSTKSVTTINILNASTNPPGGPLSYTLLLPGSGSVTGSGSLAPISQFTVSIPGTYTAITKDNLTLCETRVPFSVIQNTAGPNLSVSVPQQILSCAQPSVQLLASSLTNNVGYVWAFPLGTIPSSSINVVTNTTVSATNTLTGNYTITVKDNNNLCATSSVIPIYQNLFSPNAKISTGISSNTVISCGNPTLMLTNISTSGIPTSVFPATMAVIGLVWNGPSPLLPASNSSTYLATTGGVYTLTAKDLNNGCISSTVISISDTRVLPVVNDPGPFTVGCPNGTVQLSANYPNGTSNLTFSWTSPSNATVSGTTSQVLTTNAPGYYTLTVTNTVTGCYTQVTLSAWACVGIDKQISTINTLKVSPNPAEDLISVQLKNPGKKSVLKVVNALGQVVLEQNDLNDQAKLDVSALPNGIYFIYQLQEQKTVAMSKLIKQ